MKTVLLRCDFKLLAMLFHCLTEKVSSPLCFCCACQLKSC